MTEAKNQRVLLVDGTYIWRDVVEIEKMIIQKEEKLHIFIGEIDKDDDTIIKVWTSTYDLENKNLLWFENMNGLNRLTEPALMF